jgi:UDP-N-acetylmuramoyl-L-alanyl-D-glutamate--2,6-diaminopimelate ligase
MNLATLLKDSAVDGQLKGPVDAVITDLVADSRRVEPGTVFVALRGLSVDGHIFIPAALDSGASAVIAEEPPPADLPSRTAWLQVDCTALSFGQLAHSFFERPSEALTVLAVTGTNGKTTVSWLLDHILTTNGYQTGLLGTIETRFSNVQRSTIFTTPFPDELHGVLAEMRAHGCTHAIIEASSHGLEQQRIAGVEVDIGGFTNLTRDHMDYHGTMDAYREAKSRLFSDYALKACFNVDDPTGAAFAETFTGHKKTISVSGAPADLSVVEMVSSLDGVKGSIRTDQGLISLELNLVGRHNFENAMIAMGMAALADIPLAQAAAALTTMPQIPGRLEKLEGSPRVLVDYAHTPDALENVLRTLRPMVEGRIICVFGAGGDRDKGKRAEMGRVVSTLADLSLITSDNPRHEVPKAIIADILEGVLSTSDKIVQPDRYEAIMEAVRSAGPDDLVLLAGKGHETFQTIGDDKRHFDDREIGREALASLKQGGGS